MWKVRAGLMCVVNSSIFDSSFFDFSFLVPFLRVQTTITRISSVVRDTTSEVAERVSTGRGMVL